MSAIGLTLLLSIFFAVGFGMIGHATVTMRASKIAGSWPTTEGSLTRSFVNEIYGSDITTYEARVEYSYSVDGVRYSGDRIAFGYTPSSERKVHQEIADRVIGAKKIVVRYDPGDASRAVLAYGINQSSILMLIFGATWTLFIAGITILLIVMRQSDHGILSTLVIIK
jgi:hypothetical protein